MSKFSILSTKHSVMDKKLYKGSPEDMEIMNSLFSNNNSMPSHKQYPNIGGVNMRQNNDSDSDTDSDTDIKTTYYLKDEKDTRSNNEIRESITTYGLSGLMNIGNTCYMNSVIQCLVSIDLLRSYLIDRTTNYYDKTLIAVTARKYRKKNKLDNNSPITLKRSDLNNTTSYKLKTLFERMWDNNKLIRPDGFKQLIGKLRPDEFSGFKQCDSHELLVLILDEIHEDLVHDKRGSLRFCNASDELSTYNRVTKYYAEQTRDPNLTDKQIKELQQKINMLDDKYKREKFLMAARIFWNKDISSNYSIIRRLCSGLFCYEILCEECNNTYINFQIFTTLSLPIPENNKKISIVDCLKQYSLSQRLCIEKNNGRVNDNRYKCSGCNKKTNAIRTAYVWQPPKILIVHFNRFKHTGYNIRKIDTNISYPLKNLKLDACYSSYNTHDISYNLFAVNKHSGSYHGGHYTACRKNSLNGLWYDCNDSTISNIPNNMVERQVITKQGYMLLYEMA